MIMIETARPMIRCLGWLCLTILLAVPAASAMETGAPVQIGSTSATNATLGIPRWKGYVHETDPERIWISYANMSSQATNITYTTDGGGTWSTEVMNPNINGYLDYHVSLFGKDGNLHFTFPSADGIAYRKYSAPALTQASAEPKEIMPGTSPHFRSAVTVDGQNRTWIFTRSGDAPSENVGYFVREEGSEDWQGGQAYDTNHGDVRIGAFPYVDGRVCLVVLYLNSPRGYEYYLWNGQEFEARSDHQIFPENVGFDRRFTHNVTGGDSLHLLFSNNQQLLHVWKEDQDGEGEWTVEVIAECPYTEDHIWAPISTVYRDHLYVFYVKQTSSALSSAQIWVQRWSPDTETWSEPVRVSTNTSHNAHPNTGFWITDAAESVPVFWVAGATGQQIMYSRVSADAPVVAAAPAGPPSAVKLDAAHPNPFNPSTRVPFSLAREARISLRIHDAAGKLVTVLAEGTRAAGDHAAVWHGTDRTGRAVSSGVYFAVLEANGGRQTVKLTLAK